MLILVFIFLTPKRWFESTRFRQNHTQTTIVLASDVFGAQPDWSVLEQRARQVAGRVDAEVTALRERRDANGMVIAYEVDIR